jgi:hypothetical protein
MSHYRAGIGSKTRSKFQRTRTVITVASVTLFLLVPVIIYIIYTTLPPNPVTGKAIDRGFFDPSITFETEWYKFSVPKNWVVNEASTKEGQVYAYNHTNGSELVGLLQVYINTAPPVYQQAFSRILPITIEGDKIVPTTLQPHCKDTAKPVNKGNPVEIVQAEVRFTCWVDNNNLYAAAGEVGSDVQLTHKSPNGEDVKYFITYSNTAFTPNEGSFVEALRNFEFK